MRRCELYVSIENKEVTKEITPYLLSLSYTEKFDDELDDLQLVFEDRERKFQGDWMPKPGDKIEARIYTYDWEFYGDYGVVQCGYFEVDEIELDSSFDGGDIVTVKAIPAVVKSSLMNQKKTRAWADVTLAEVASDIAGEAGLATLYKAPQIVYERIEQRAEHDLEFLQRVCKDQGLRLRIKMGKLIVYMGQTADATAPIEFAQEKKPAVHVFDRNLASLDNVRFRKTMANVYTECRVSYNDARDSEEIDFDFKPGDPPKTKKILTINKRVEHPAQAERLARAELRDKNSQEITGSFVAMGNSKYVAGCVIEFKGWGNFDRKYAIKQVRHDFSFENGYTCEVDFELALEY